MRAGDDGALTIVRQWVEKADSDFKTAVHMLKLRRGCPTDTVWYHTQQCVEKYLKAMLVLHDMQVPHVHDVRLLVDRLPSDVQPDLTPEERERMTEYAVTTRYPGDYDPISWVEARRAVQIARRVRRQGRQHQPVLVKSRTYLI